MLNSFFLKNLISKLNFSFFWSIYKSKKINTKAPSNINHFLENKVFLFFIIFFCLAFQALSYLTLWTDSEIYPVHISQYLFSQYANEFLFSLKPLFYSILKLSFSLSSWLDWLPMTGGRFLFAFNGLAILTLMYFYIKNTSSRYNAVLAVLFLAGMNIFLDRAFRIRSDLLCSSLSLICLLISLNIKDRKDNWKFYILISFLSLLLLTTPKGVYWLCFSLLLIWQNIKIKVQKQFILKIVFFICLCFYFLSLLFKDPFFITAVYEAINFYLFNLSETYNFILKNNWLTSLYELSHVGLFIERNPFLFLIIILKFIFIIFSLFILKNRKKDWSDLYFFILCFIALFHPQQKLFFLSALSPFFCIAFFTDDLWQRALNRYSKVFKTFLLAGFFIYTFSYTSYFSYKIYTKRNNLQQKKLIKDLNDFYKDTTLSINIFDPNCIIYTRKTKCEYILQQKNLKNLSNYLENKNFDIILSSFAVFPYELIVHKKSNFKYINIKNHIYYKAFITDETHNFIETQKNIESINGHDFDLNNNFNSDQFLQKIPNQSQKKIRTELPYKNSLTLKTNENLKHRNLKKQINKIKKDQKALRGENILKSFEQEQEKQITVPKQYRKYFYLYIDKLDRVRNKTIDCANNNSLSLKEGCYYSEDQFKKGLIPITNKRIALFYIPFPFHINSEKSLRLLLRYDRF